MNNDVTSIVKCFLEEADRIFYTSMLNTEKKFKQRICRFGESFPIGIFREFQEYLKVKKDFDLRTLNDREMRALYQN